MFGLGGGQQIPDEHNEQTEVFLMEINNQRRASQAGVPGLGPFELFLVGWKLIISELYWSLKSLCRLWEIRQLKKRLSLENIRLAQLVQKKAVQNMRILDLMNPEIDLALGQLSLLKEEIDYLGKEMQARRDVFVENRRQSCLKIQT
jgi:hypothetical protein